MTRGMVYNNRLHMPLIYFQKNPGIPRLPLRPTNPKANMKRGGTLNTRNNDPTSSIPIPSNPITRQPKGQQPPTTFVGKENKQPVLLEAPHFTCKGKDAKGLKMLAFTDSEEKKLFQDVSSPYKREVKRESSKS